MKLWPLTSDWSGKKKKKKFMLPETKFQKEAIMKTQKPEPHLSYLLFIPFISTLCKLTENKTNSGCVRVLWTRSYSHDFMLNMRLDQIICLLLFFMLCKTAVLISLYFCALL